MNGQPHGARGESRAGGHRTGAAEGRGRGRQSRRCADAGTVVTLAVKAGKKVKKGDPLLSIEAMKMETMLTAERDATVHAVHVKPGEAVNAKDLLLELG